MKKKTSTARGELAMIITGAVMIAILVVCVSIALIDMLIISNDNWHNLGVIILLFFGCPLWCALTTLTVALVGVLTHHRTHGVVKVLNVIGVVIAVLTLFSVLMQALEIPLLMEFGQLVGYLMVLELAAFVIGVIVQTIVHIIRRRRKRKQPEAIADAEIMAETNDSDGGTMQDDSDQS